MAGVKGRSGRKKNLNHSKATLKCTVCGEDKAPDEFYTNKARASERQTACKKCNSRVAFEASCRRAIKNNGVEAFARRIAELEDRATIMRRILLKHQSKAKTK